MASWPGSNVVGSIMKAPACVPHIIILPSLILLCSNIQLPFVEIFKRDHFDFSHLKPAAMSDMPRICVLRVEKGPSQEIEIEIFLEQIVFYIFRIYIRKVTGLSENMTGR